MDQIPSGDDLEVAFDAGIAQTEAHWFGPIRTAEEGGTGTYQWDVRPVMGLKRRLAASIGYAGKIAVAIRLGRWLHLNLPGRVGTALSVVIDKLVFFFYTVDGSSRRIDVADLRIPHPGGVLLGGNGICSKGRVLVNAGAMFIGPMPDDPEYLARHATGDVFVLGDNVVVGANSVLIGPLTICDNVLIGAMSLVTKDITEPGVYVGSPARKISDAARDVWF